MEYKRAQYQEILNRINEPRGKMQVLVGPRQVGKSTLINPFVVGSGGLSFEEFLSMDLELLFK